MTRYDTPGTHYAENVVKGTIVACLKVTLACQRFLNDLDNSSKPDFPWEFNPELAQRPMKFMERFLVPSKGDYEELKLMGWQCFVEENIYGWVDKKNGKRRFDEALIMVGRGNGKSTLISGNAIFGVCKDNERGADVYLLANAKEQSAIVFDECYTQIKTSSTLTRRFRQTQKAIFYDETNGKIMHRASDSKKLDGLNPHIAIFDELHEYRNFKLINVVSRGMKKRRQPLRIYITTAGTVLDGPLIFYYDLFYRAMIPEDEGGLATDVADKMFCFICEQDNEQEIDKPELWIKSNPSIGYLLSLNDLINDWNRCQLVPEERSDYITKQLNYFANDEDAAYIDYNIMKRNYGTYPTEDLLGRDCYGGFDLASTEDFTAAALEFPLENGRFYVIQHAWIPKSKVEKDNEKIPYYEWALQGLLTIVDKEYVPQEVVYDWFMDMAKKYNILSIGYDPANALKLQRMMTDSGFNLNIVRQGSLTLSAPMKDIRQELLDGNIFTNKNPLFFWFLGNVRLSKNAREVEKGNMMPTKRNRYRKIDGFMAWLDAHVEYLRNCPSGVDMAEPSITVFNLFDLAK